MIIDNLSAYKPHEALDRAARRRLTLHFTPTCASWLNQVLLAGTGQALPWTYNGKPLAARITVLAERDTRLSSPTTGGVTQ